MKTLHTSYSVFDYKKSFNLCLKRILQKRDVSVNVFLFLTRCWCLNTTHSTVSGSAWDEYDKGTSACIYSDQRSLRIINHCCEAVSSTDFKNILHTDWGLGSSICNRFSVCDVKSVTCRNMIAIWRKGTRVKYVCMNKVMLIFLLKSSFIMLS